jgi:hypothetical protein
MRLDGERRLLGRAQEVGRENRAPTHALACRSVPSRFVLEYDGAICFAACSDQSVCPIQKVDVRPEAAAGR